MPLSGCHSVRGGFVVPRDTAAAPGHLEGFQVLAASVFAISASALGIETSVPGARCGPLLVPAGRTGK